MKALLASQEQANPQLFKSLLSTIRPLIMDGLEDTKVESREARIGTIAH
jgi:hypothetical protein